MGLLLNWLAEEHISTSNSHFWIFAYVCVWIHFSPHLLQQLCMQQCEFQTLWCILKDLTGHSWWAAYRKYICTFFWCLQRYWYLYVCVCVKSFVCMVDIPLKRFTYNINIFEYSSMHSVMHFLSFLPSDNGCIVFWTDMQCFLYLYSFKMYLSLKSVVYFSYWPNWNVTLIFAYLVIDNKFNWDIRLEPSFQGL